MTELEQQCECMVMLTQAINLNSSLMIKQMTNEDRIQQDKSVAYGEDEFDADWRYLGDIHRQCCDIRKRLGIAGEVSADHG